MGKSHWRRRAQPLAFLLLIVACSAPSFAQERAVFVPGAPPNTVAKQNEVYGLVKFALESSRSAQPTKDPIRVLLESLSALLTKAGEYILTVEVLSDTDEVLARRAIVQTKREESGFLIFNRIKKQSETTEWYGTLLTTQPVDNKVNNVRLRVRSYYTSQTKFDLATFNLILDFLANTQGLGVTPALQAAWSHIADQMAKLLSSYEQNDVSDIATMSFVKLTEQPYPQSGSFTKKFLRTEDRERLYEAKVKVQLEPVKSRVVTLNSSGQVDDPFALQILAVARGPGGFGRDAPFQFQELGCKEAGGWT
jgi:hypothetical protein